VLTSSTVSQADVVAWRTFGNKAEVQLLFNLLAGTTKDVPKLGSLGKKPSAAGKKPVLEFAKTIPKDSTSALALRTSLLSIGCSLTDFLPPATRKTLMAVVKTPANELVDPAPEATELLTLANDLGGSSDTEGDEMEEMEEMEEDV
jgi:hypothetical protein